MLGYYSLAGDPLAVSSVPDALQFGARNYPNPFNPKTTIDFSLPSAETVSLRIYDERGRLVRTLVDGLAPEGNNQVMWDGKDNRGRSVASGVYHYVLKSASGDLRHKMTLIR